MPEMLLDLEEGGRITSEVVVEDLPHSENLSRALSHQSHRMGPHPYPLCLILCGAHQHSLVAYPLWAHTTLPFV